MKRIGVDGHYPSRNPVQWEPVAVLDVPRSRSAISVGWMWVGALLGESCSRLFICSPKRLIVLRGIPDYNFILAKLSDPELEKEDAGVQAGRLR